MKVHIKAWETGDWFEVEVDGEPYPLCSGHSIHYVDLIPLLERAGVTVTREEVPSDEDDE